MQGLRSKYIVIIASGGRTGTTFFGELLGQIIDDSFSVHEPDVVDGSWRRAVRKIKVFGFYHMVIGRILGHTGIRNLTQKYLAGKISHSELVKAIHDHRGDYYRSFPQKLVIESYYQWFGILPAVADLFPNYRIVGIIRDPRTWVTSRMNYGGQFDDTDLVLKLGQQRLEPAMISDHEYTEKWSRMSVFAKHCWQWKTITALLLNQSQSDDNARIFSFENLFLSDDRAKHVTELLAFVTRFEDRIFDYNFDPEVLNKVRNPSTPGKFPNWREWTNAMAQELDEICGCLMKKLDYGLERDWNTLISTHSD